jgi:hypothetical protein
MLQNSRQCQAIVVAVLTAFSDFIRDVYEPAAKPAKLSSSG